MSQNEAVNPALFSEIRPRSETRRFLRVFFGRKVVAVGLFILIAVIIVAIFAPVIAPYDPYEVNFSAVLEGPSTQHLLGTDGVGRDTLSRIIYGARISLLVGIVSIGLSAVVGMSLGLIAGFFGGFVDAIIMRGIDVLMAFPTLLLALSIAAILGGGIRNVIIAIGLGLMSGFARLMRGQVLSVKENDYVTAARSMGSNSWLIMLQHVAPNCFPPLIVLITMQLGHAIIVEAGLSFLGIGITPPTAAWGAMTSEGFAFITINPVLAFAPGVAIMLVVFAFNMIGDGLRDALDPRLRGTL